MAEQRQERGDRGAKDAAGEQNRTPRSGETRAALADEDTWAPPALLPDPPEHPDYVHRWVRTAILGNPDSQNVSTRFREGWEPAPADEYPDFQHLTDAEGKWGKKGCIEVGGLMLCRASRRKMAARDAYHERMASNQMQAVESQLLGESDSRMPIEKPSVRTKTTFGSR